MTRRVAGDLVRFAFDKGKVGKPSQVKRLFVPNSSGLVSVGKTEELECDEILELGLRFRELQANPRPIYGWIELEEDAVFENKLEIDYDDDPPRHANIGPGPEKSLKDAQTRNELFRLCTKKAKFPQPVTEIGQLANPCRHVKPLHESNLLPGPGTSAAAS